MSQYSKRVLIILLSLLAIVSIAKSFYYTEKFGGTDLRCRIVGSRLLLTDQSPYFYKWHNGDDVRYLDPNDELNRKVNGNVVTPALLLLNKPLSLLSYKYIRILWTVILYVLFGLSLFFIWKVNESKKKIFLPLAIILLGFMMSDSMFCNVERGQTYILYAFIFSLSYFVYNSKSRYNHLLAGAITGISIWLRPLFLLLNIPFLLQKDFKWVLGSAIGFVLGLFVFFLPLKATWADYSNAMKHYEMEQLGKESYVPTNHLITKPKDVEGVSNLTDYKSGFASAGMSNLQHIFKARGYELRAPMLIALFAVVVIICSLFFLWKNSVKQFDTHDLFLFGFLLYMMSELFLIGARGGYNNIQWIFPAFIMLIFLRENIVAVAVLLLGIAFMNGWPFLFPNQSALGEAIMFYVLVDYIFIRRLTVDRCNGENVRPSGLPLRH
ncbi:glycosyltransferase 87 family protein [Pinibacter aurantiacus]|uniref:DUF2029 domain-containing protein n=1 Tax=Pinibacter aurantiacus TaxID=2851599 RepID=A0A9E2SEP3_9BACT|nr:glycosyltransferase 87 family protein [Pinibacter aurantiacus]MBV4359729.1 DUF2029 domain-containing protein [Pinibacter aurantiacus]